MSHRFDFNTRELWLAQSQNTGDAGPGSNDPATGQPFTEILLKQAEYRGNAYIRTIFYDFFKDENKAVDLASLPDNVREDLTEATNYACSHELLTPGFYSKTITHTNASDAQLKKKTVGPITNEYFEQKGGDTVTRVRNEQNIDLTIHALLDKYRINPDSDAGTTPASRRCGVGVMSFVQGSK